MTVTLYLDVFFLVNFGMDYLLLLMVKRLLHLPASHGRLCLAAGMGAGWACFDLLFPVRILWLRLFLTWIGAGGAMILTAFAARGFWHCPWEIRRMVSCLTAFWMVSALAGGILSTLGEQTFAGGYLAGTRAVCQWRLFPLCFWAAGIYFGVCAWIQAAGKRSREQSLLVQVRLSYQGAEKKVTALWDTGNQLYEPYGGQPVHVITSQAFRPLCKSMPNMIYIPFRAVGTENGMLPGVRIDSMEVEKEGKVVRRYERPWLAVSQKPLSVGHRYEMLLHGEET